MISVPDPKDLVEQIRKAQEEKNYTIEQVISLMKEKGYYPLGGATISRLINGVKEVASYDYLKSIIPLYNTIVDDMKDEDKKIEAMRVLLEYKLECIEDLKEKLDAKDKSHKEEIEKLKAKNDAKKDEYLAKSEEQRNHFQDIMDFRANQIIQKDEMIQKLLETNCRLSEHICNCREKGKCQ